MVETGQRRKLAAILSADVFGYSRLMQDDEAATVETLTKYRHVFSDFVTRHDGRVVDSPGDNILAAFDSPVEAVQCAVEIQRELGRRNRQLADHRQMRFRIGVNLGDVLSRDDGTIYGDGVNIAARLESLAEPGGIMISDSARMQVRTLIDVGIADAGEHEVKNIADPVHVFRIVLDESAAPVGTAGRRRWGLLVGAGALVALVAAAGIGWWISDRPDETPSLAAGPDALDSQRIAVLPLTNISRDPEDEYFADGMTEELISKLSRIAGLAVIARTSAMSYKGTDKRVDEIGRELGVGTILEGSVRKAGDALRITGQLIDVASQQHLWSQDYDRTFKDVFAIQTDIAQQVADILQVTLLSDEHRKLGAHGTESLDAYNSYLKGLYQFNKFSLEGYNNAIRFYEQAIEQDPSYPQAWAGLAFSLEEIGYFNYRPANEVYPQSEAAALKALELDDGVAEGYLVLGLVKGHYDWDWPAAETALRRAIALNPNDAMAHWAYGVGYLVQMERFDEAVFELQEAQKLDPLSLNAVGDLTWVLYQARRYDRAVEQALMALEMDPDTVNTLRALGATYIEMGRHDEAIETLHRAVVASGNWSGVVAFLGLAYARAGRPDESLRLLDEFEQRAQQEEISALHFFLIYLGLGETDEALDWLETAYEERLAELVNVNSWPCSDPLRAEPRFIEVMTKIGVLQQ